MHYINFPHLVHSMYYIYHAFFLTACAQHWEMHKEESIGNELEESSGEIQTEQLPGLCWACKWAMGKLKKQISNGTTADEIKNKLGTTCDQIGFLKSLCRKFVNKYMGTLIEELSTTDDARTICVNIGICK
uniref:Saposin B-type domain-containing protein n=2 Tax=Cyprinus carpio TaxID=7962 RepID=A0A9J7Z5N0_CYPCA